jgi:hypothetical protein
MRLEDIGLVGQGLGAGIELKAEIAVICDTCSAIALNGLLRRSELQLLE